MSVPNTESNRPQPLDEWFLAVLACPGCPERRQLHLNGSQDALLCECGRYSYPIRDGIPILLVEEATVLNPDITPGNITR